MGLIEMIGSVLAIVGILTYLLPEKAFRVVFFGMFDENDLSGFGRRVFKGFGFFCVVEGALLVVLVSL